jgi:hypothetical protein
MVFQYFLLGIDRLAECYRRWGLKVRERTSSAISCYALPILKPEECNED